MAKVCKHIAIFLAFYALYCKGCCTRVIFNQYLHDMYVYYFWLCSLDPSMKWLHKIVIPHVSFCWNKVADFLEYSIPKKNEIAVRQRDDPYKCCSELLEDWLSTSKTKDMVQSSGSFKGD